MITEKTIELMNKEIDGENTANEQAELQRILNDSTEAQSYFSELNQVSKIINNSVKIDPPAYLKNSILNSIAIEPLKAQEKQSVWEDLFTGLIQAQRIRYVVAFSGGMIAGLLVFFFYTSSNTKPTDYSGISGTIGVAEQTDTTHDGKHLQLNVNGISGNIDTKHVGNGFRCELTLTARATVDLRFKYDPSLMEFYGFTKGEESVNDLKIEKGTVRLSHQGSNKYVLSFSGKSPASTLGFTILSDDTILYEHDFNL